MGLAALNQSFIAFGFPGHTPSLPRPRAALLPKEKTRIVVVSPPKAEDEGSNIIEVDVTIVGYRVPAMSGVRTAAVASEIARRRQYQARGRGQGYGCVGVIGVGASFP